MPATSKAQFRLMKAAEHNPKFAKQVGISPKTAAEYTSSNVKGKSYGHLPQYKADGGSVNEAGNYTKPGMRKALFEKIKGQSTQGTAAGQWSARKSQLLAKQYKARGGGYRD